VRVKYSNRKILGTGSESLRWLLPVFSPHEAPGAKKVDAVGYPKPVRDPSPTMDEVFFDYFLPSDLIAQQPCPERDRSRLLVLRRAEGTITHHTFADLPKLLDPGDLLVLNDTRVLPARLVGRRARTGGKWEGLFIRELASGEWEILSQSRGKLAAGEMIDLEPGPLRLRLVERRDEGQWIVQADRAGTATELLQAHGHVPLPHYIRKGIARADDGERYQTLYARRSGAIAAPTAGLHFTPAVFTGLEQKGILWTFVTLHVGQGTFRPIQVEDYRRHLMHREWGELPPDAEDEIARCQSRGGRVVAVGTTSVRVLESVASMGPIRHWSGKTNLFIYPPYPFKAVDALITNFHLPRSSLLLLVNAFAGAELTRRAYQTAMEENYRFYSYGDAMLII
jgi:S-adenosylmethionine:tRNA ribosyltransferase-isomerase